MQNMLKIVLPIAVLVVGAIVMFALFAVRPVVEQTPATLPTLLVQVATAQPEAVTFTIKSQGTVTPRTQTTLVAESAGQIVEVSPNFVSGGFFRQGDVLIRIDPRRYEAGVKKAQAQVARATTQASTESALAGYAAKDWQRLRGLTSTSNAASPLTLRKPQLEQALAELLSAEAELSNAEDDLARTVFRAPYDGLVREKLADVGQFVSSGAQLARTFAVDKAEIRLPVTQQDLPFLDIGRLRAGQPIGVRISANIGGSEYPWEARITRSEGVFDPSTRALHLVAEVQDPYDLAITGRVPLLVGTFVQAEIDGRSGGELYRVPRHALYRGDTLWLVDADNKIYPQVVNIVRSGQQDVFVDAGLQPGDRYCVTPIDQPLPGMQVRFRE